MLHIQEKGRTLCSHKMQPQPAMKHSIHLIIFFLFLSVLTVGCTSTDKEKDESMGNSYKSLDTR